MSHQQSIALQLSKTSAIPLRMVAIQGRYICLSAQQICSTQSNRTITRTQQSFTESSCTNCSVAAQVAVQVTAHKFAHIAVRVTASKSSLRKIYLATSICRIEFIL